MKRSGSEVQILAIYSWGVRSLGVLSLRPKLETAVQCRSRQVQDRWLQRIEAVVQRQQRVAPERDHYRFLRLGQGC